MNAYGAPWPSLDTWINHLSITPDSTILIAACLDRTIRLWNLATNEPLCAPLKGHTNSVRCTAIMPDGTLLLSGADDGNIRLWKLAQPEEAIATWQAAHRGAVRCLSMAPNGQIAASAGDDGMVRMWNMLDQEPLGNPIKGHASPVSALSFNTDGDLIISGDESGCLTVWTFENNILKSKLHLRVPNSPAITGITPLPGTNDIVTSCTDSTIRRWDLTKSLQVGNPWKEHTDAVRCLGLIQDKVITGSSDYSIRIWDAAGQPVGEAWLGPQTSVETLAVAPNGKVVVSAGSNEMWTWLLA